VLGQVERDPCPHLAEPTTPTLPRSAGCATNSARSTTSAESGSYVSSGTAPSCHARKTGIDERPHRCDFLGRDEERLVAIDGIEQQLRVLLDVLRLLLLLVEEEVEGAPLDLVLEPGTLRPELDLDRLDRLELEDDRFW
jgi:hypothetical protein